MVEETVAHLSFFVGRVLFGGVLAVAGANHFFELENMVEYTEHLPFARLSVVGGGVAMVVGGLSVVFEVYPLVGSSVLAVFLAGSTPVVHDFWNYERGDEPLNYEALNFLKNVGLLGGALVFVSLSLTSSDWAYGVGLRLIS